MEQRNHSPNTCIGWGEVEGGWGALSSPFPSRGTRGPELYHRPTEKRGTQSTAGRHMLFHLATAGKRHIKDTNETAAKRYLHEYKA